MKWFLTFALLFQVVVSPIKAGPYDPPYLLWRSDSAEVYRGDFALALKEGDSKARILEGYQQGLWMTRLLSGVATAAGAMVSFATVTAGGRASALVPVFIGAGLGGSLWALQISWTAPWYEFQSESPFPIKSRNLTDFGVAEAFRVAEGKSSKPVILVIPNKDGTTYYVARSENFPYDLNDRTQVEAILRDPQGHFAFFDYRGINPMLQVPLSEGKLLEWAQPRLAATPPREIAAGSQTEVFVQAVMTSGFGRALVGTVRQMNPNAALDETLAALLLQENADALEIPGRRAAFEIVLRPHTTIPPKQRLELVAASLADPDPLSRFAGAKALSLLSLKDESSIRIITQALHTPDQTVQKQLVSSLSKMPRSPLTELWLLFLVTSPDREVREAAHKALTENRPERLYQLWKRLGEPKTSGSEPELGEEQSPARLSGEERALLEALRKIEVGKTEADFKAAHSAAADLFYKRRYKVPYWRRPEFHGEMNGLIRKLSASELATLPLASLAPLLSRASWRALLALERRTPAELLEAPFGAVLRHAKMEALSDEAVYSKNIFFKALPVAAFIGSCAMLAAKLCGYRPDLSYPQLGVSAMALELGAFIGGLFLDDGPVHRYHVERLRAYLEARLAIVPTRRSCDLGIAEADLLSPGVTLVGPVSELE